MGLDESLLSKSYFKLNQQVVSGCMKRLRHTEAGSRSSGFYRWSHKRSASQRTATESKRQSDMKWISHRHFRYLREIIQHVTHTVVGMDIRAFGRYKMAQWGEYEDQYFLVDSQHMAAIEASLIALWREGIKVNWMSPSLPWWWRSPEWPAWRNPSHPVGGVPASPHSPETHAAAVISPCVHHRETSDWSGAL